MQVLSTLPSNRRRGRSALALAAGFLSVLVLSLVTDQVLHELKFYPPWGEPMVDPVQNAVALAYRCVYAIFGSYLAARLAPHRPMWHAMVLGFIGLVLSTLGSVAAMMANLGPLWYPVALIVSTLPCAWLGGVLYRPKG